MTAPVSSSYVTSTSIFKDMFLVELMRGCPHRCAFCILASGRLGRRVKFFSADQVLGSIPAWARRVGLVGASVLDHPQADRILEELVRSGIGIGISSLRAARLTEERCDLLAAGGMSTLTIAIDAPSERIRRLIRKPVTRSDLLAAATHARRAGIKKLKLYILVGFEGEEPGDHAELVDTCRELGAIMPVTASVSPVVPKRFTPLEAMPFVDRRAYEAVVAYLRKSLRGPVTLKAESYRTARLEHELTRLDREAAAGRLTSL